MSQAVIRSNGLGPEAYGATSATGWASPGLRNQLQSLWVDQDNPFHIGFVSFLVSREQA